MILPMGSRVLPEAALHGPVESYTDERLDTRIKCGFKREIMRAPAVRSCAAAFRRMTGTDGRDRKLQVRETIIEIDGRRRRVPRQSTVVRAVS